MAEGQGEKWKGLRRLARKFVFSDDRDDTYEHEWNEIEAELRRELEPLLEAVVGAEKLLCAMNRTDTNKILKELDKWR